MAGLCLGSMAGGNLSLVTNSPFNLVILNFVTGSDYGVPTGLELTDLPVSAGIKVVCHHVLPKSFFKAGFHCLDQFGLKFVTLLPYSSKLATTPCLGSKDFKNVFF